MVSLEAVDVPAAPVFDEDESLVAAPELESGLEQPVAIESAIRVQTDSTTERMVTSGVVGGTP
jgi:hypothetical protein